MSEHRQLVRVRVNPWVQFKRKLRASTGLHWVALTCSAAGLASACSAETGEQMGSVQGELILRVARYADLHAERQYSLKTTRGESLALRFDSIAPPSAHSQLRVFGRREGNQFQVENLQVLADAGLGQLRAAFTSAAPKVAKTALLNLDSNFSMAKARQRLLEDADSPRQFYLENSYGAWSIEGDAFGPYNVSTSGCSDEDVVNIRDQAMQAAKTAGVTLDDYENVMNYLPSSAACQWQGLGAVGIVPARGYLSGRDTWYANASDCVVLAQELGHNYGMLHSHRCNAPPYQNYDELRGDTERTTCAGFNEYGDAYTPMANGCGHLNAVEMGEMAFVKGCNTVTLKSDGEYELAPLEVKTDAVQILRISNKLVKEDPQFIYLEYRKSRLNSDSKSAQGVYLHAGPDYIRHNRPPPPNPDTGELVDPFLLLPHGSVNNAALLVGEEWQEPDSGATFKVVAWGDTAKVQVKLKNSTGEAPECFTPDAGGTGGSGAAGNAGAAGSAGKAGQGGAGKAGSAGKAAGGAGNTGGGGANAGSGNLGNAGGGNPGSAGNGGAASDNTSNPQSQPGCSCRLSNHNSAANGAGWFTSLAGAVAFYVRKRRRSAAR